MKMKIPALVVQGELKQLYVIKYCNSFVPQGRSTQRRALIQANRNQYMASSLNNILHTLHSGTFPTNYVKAVSEYSINLDSKGLPIIYSTEHLALLIGTNPKSLRNIINHPREFYSSFKIRKVSGGYRWILAPNDELKHIQNWIKFNILDRINIHERANGFVKTKSIFSNASIHTNSDVILNIDLYRFFDTISAKRVYGIFKNAGYIKNLSFDLALLLCSSPPDMYWLDIEKEGIIRIPVSSSDKLILPQGSPASPTVTNILCYKLDVRLSGLCKTLNCNYSRYADDITFSGNKEHIPSINTIKKIIKSEGFIINDNKIKYLSKNKSQLVTGLVVNQNVSVRKDFMKEVELHLHFCKKYGPTNHLAYLESKGKPIKSNYKHWLLGKISFVNSIDKIKAKQLFEKFNLIEWEL